MARLFSDACASVSDPWLRRACELAERGRAATSPNPLVGCVLVLADRVVGEGFHERAGGPHAETAALAAAGDSARGATAYVTLEPCNHHGRTAPCAPALVHAGVARVVVGMRDPNPKVTGGGADLLRDAGIEVVFADDPAPFEEQNREWIHFALTGRPHVRVKTAITLDGHPALAPDTRSAITGEGARALTMRLRSRADAVLTGAATVAIDDPSLTVRDADGAPATRQPRRIVLARTAQPPSTARLFNDARGRAILLLPEEADPDPGIEALADVVTYPIADGLPGALHVLGGLGVVDLLVEAGPRLLSALWDDDLVDELVLYHAGGMGGDGAPALFVGESPQDPESLLRRMRAVETGLVGSDAVTVWRRVGAEHDE